MSLLYLTLTIIWLALFVLRFKSSKTLSYLLGLTAYLSAVFNSLGVVFKQFQILEGQTTDLLFYASLHLWITSLLCLLLINVADIPDKQRLKIVSKVLILSFFIGMTKGLGEYQFYIFLVLITTILALSFYFSVQMPLTFTNTLIGGSFLMTFLIFKILGFDILLLLIIAMIFLKTCIDHFVLSIRGNSEFFK